MLVSQLEKGRTYAARDGTELTVRSIRGDGPLAVIEWSTNRGATGTGKAADLAKRILADVTPESLELDQLLAEHVVARMIGQEVKTLRNWRYAAAPPAAHLRAGCILPHVKVGQMIRYRPLNVRQFLEVHGQPIVRASAA